MAYCSEVIIPGSLDLNIVVSHSPWDSYALVLIKKYNQSLDQIQFKSLYVNVSPPTLKQISNTLGFSVEVLPYTYK
jgi:hypothetical protein